MRNTQIKNPYKRIVAGKSQDYATLLSNCSPKENKTDEFISQMILHNTDQQQTKPNLSNPNVNSHTPIKVGYRIMNEQE